MRGMSLEKAQELNNTDLWKDVCKELDFRIFNLIQQLKICGIDEVREKQVRIATFEELKNLPVVIINREESSQSVSE